MVQVKALDREARIIPTLLLRDAETGFGIVLLCRSVREDIDCDFDAPSRQIRVFANWPRAPQKIQSH